MFQTGAVSRLARRNPLAACVAAVFALTAPLARAAPAVTNCNDSGVGSLREAVNGAVNNDTVDLTGLTTASPGCTNSTITLTTGSIFVGVTNLTISRAGKTALFITGKSNGSNGMFYHFGTGTLAFDTVVMKYGYDKNTSVGGAAKGGCVYSKGSVSINKSTLKYCTTAADSGSAEGGAIFAKGGVTLTNSYVEDSGARSTSGIAKGGCIYGRGKVTLTNSHATVCKAQTTTGVAKGGAIYAVQDLGLYSSVVSNNRADGGTSGNPSAGAAVVSGNLVMLYSSVSGNGAYGAAGNSNGLAGGIYATGASTHIVSSTIAGNVAGHNIGGIAIGGSSASSTDATIKSSTISGNKATSGFIGGVYSRVPKMYLYNSTIALNNAGQGGPTEASGLALYGPPGATAKLNSTLVANNTYGPASASNDLFAAGVTVSGSNNLVRTSIASLPNGTLRNVCPLLGPLRANGGPTQTHALLGHSPALDSGNNLLALSFDQRGSPFARVSGPPGAMTPLPDIGAYEVNRSDVIFDVNFEGCP